jgi:hypothetical protein
MTSPPLHLVSLLPLPLPLPLPLLLPLPLPRRLSATEIAANDALISAVSRVESV